MSKINKFLCEWFKSEKDECVTLGSFTVFSLFYSIVIAIICILFYSVFKFISEFHYVFNNDTTYTVGIFSAIGGTILLLILVFILVTLLAIVVTVLEYVSKIKIAKCERIKTDEFGAPQDDDSRPRNYLE